MATNDDETTCQSHFELASCCYGNHGRTTMFKIVTLLLCPLLVAGATPGGTYIITASNRIQPGTPLIVKVDVLNNTDVYVVASIEEQVFDGKTNRYEYRQLQNDSAIVNRGDPKTLYLETGMDLKCLSCQVRVRGTNGLQFEVVFPSPVSSSVTATLIQTDKAIYKPGQLVRMRICTVYSDLLLYYGPLTIEIRDPNSNLVKILTNVTSPSGVVEDSFQLGEQTVFGTWTIAALPLDLPDVRQIETFEVSDYSLPRFDITVELPNFALMKDDTLTGKIKASYTFGKPVKGHVELHIGPNEGPNYCGQLPKTVQIGFEIDGEASFSVPKSDISRAVYLRDRQETKVTAYVTDITGTRLNGSSLIKWYDNKYQIKFTDSTPNVFKAGLPYTAFIQIVTPDNKPPTEGNITLSVYTSVTYQKTVEDQALYDVAEFTGTYPLPGQNVTIPADGLVAIGIDIPNNATSVTIKATLKEVRVTKTVSKMLSKSNNFIQLSVLNSNIQSGSNVSIRIDGTEPLYEVIYVILSRGNLVDSGTLNGTGKRTFDTEFEVTPSLAPTAHLIVYYNKGTYEIVADSLAFNVEGIFNNDVTIALNKNESEPNNNVVFQVNAKPHSDVFALVVDQSVLLLKTGNDITPEKVTQHMSKFDNAEKPSGSQFALSYSATNVQEVFIKAGLTMVTDIEPPRPPPRPYDLNEANIPYQPFATYGQMEEDKMLYEPLQEVERVRSIFPEVFLWTNISVDGENGTAYITANVPDTITSWIASAFATHSSAGLGVAPTRAVLKVFRSFFVSLTYPNSLVRGEICIIQAVVFNYLSSKQTVTVTLKGSSKFESVIPQSGGLEVHESKDQVKTIQVESQKQGVVYFPILVIQIGLVDIEVSAQSSVAADGVRRQLIVRAEGAPFSFNYPEFVTLDTPGTFEKSINISLPDSVVLGSDNAQVKVTGDLIGFSLSGMETLLSLPTGCAEQSMAKFAPNVYIARYLKATGQLSDALKKIIGEYQNAGYQRQLTYKRSDNSFSPFGNSDESGNIWLTLYVARVLHEAQEFTFIDPEVPYRAVDWLIQRQNQDGSFNEFGKVLDSTTQGTGKGPALTAFALLCFIETSPLSTLHCIEGSECLKKYEWGNATEKVVKYLENSLEEGIVGDQFSLALVSYALTLANSTKADLALTKLETYAHREGGLLFWADNSTLSSRQGSRYLHWRPPHVQGRPIDILITSYAILTYTAKGKLREASPATLWLSKQRNPDGGFASSQDTSVGLQALAAFATKSIRVDTDLDVQVLNNVTLAEFNINQENALVLQIEELEKTPSKINIEVNGTGFALLEIVVNLHVSKEVRSPSFDVSTVLLDDDLDSFNLMVCTKWLWNTETGMVVQEVSIPSGFNPDLDSLGNIAGLKRSERKGNNVNIYFDKIGKTSTCYSIRMARTDKVARTQENYVRTSVYYDPKNQNTVFWQPRKLRDSSICDVCIECC